MDKLDQWIKWAKSHKKVLAKVVLFISGGMQSLGWTELAVFLLGVSIWLDGAGRAKSDNEVKANQ
jgi:hypothetical protein